MSFFIFHFSKIQIISVINKEFCQFGISIRHLNFLAIFLLFVSNKNTKKKQVFIRQNNIIFLQKSFFCF